MFFLDCIGTVNITRLLHAMEYARKRHGVDVFVIDSLFKCGLSSEDYGGQREFTDKLTTFCNNTGAHVILVAHSRKVSSGNEYTPPTKSDVSGSSDLTNGAFNVVIWFRNKLKKRKLDEARQAIPPDNETISAWMDQPDGAAILDKQRFGEGEEAKVDIFFSPETSQFHTMKNRKTPYFVYKT
jgi:twinkle protein